MSVSLNLKIVDNPVQKRKISKELVVKGKRTQYNPNPEKKCAFAIDRDNNKFYVPLSMYNLFLDEFPRNVDEYPKINLEFKGRMFSAEDDPSNRKRDQDVVSNKSIEKLENNRTVFIAAHTGFGKTSICTFLICYFGLKAMILCHSNSIKHQWADEITKFTEGEAKIQFVKGNDKLREDTQIFICGVRKASTLDRNMVRDIGILVIDEAHLCTDTAFTESLLRFEPYYLVGLSATPDRNDGLHKLINIYFGDPKNYIVREEKKNFTIHKLKTSYKPEISYTVFKGKTVPAWTAMMTSLSEIEERWIKIAELSMHHTEHKIIILCDRVNMAENIYNYLLEREESAELLIGAKKKWDKTKRILVSNIKKAGVGLNDPDLTMLILAADTKDVRQCEGRIRTLNNVVIDIVDNYKTLEDHWDMRRRWYIKRGATIKEGVL